MIVIKWYGAFKIKNGKVTEKFLFPPERRSEFIAKIRAGDFSFLGDFLDDEIKIEGEIKDKKDIIKTAIEVAKIEMKENISEDYILIETLNTYDDLISTINLLNERLIEWGKIEEIKGEENTVEGELKEEVEKLTNLKDKISNKIEELAEKVCPNTSYIVGPIIAARLIASAGGLSRLAKLPASTIQVLGAEDAFFRHLKSGAKCPKHGIIFRVPYVRNSPKKVRGKIARALAAKLAIAAKVDYYKGDFIGDKLKNELEKRIKEVGK